MSPDVLNRLRNNSDQQHQSRHGSPTAAAQAAPLPPAPQVIPNEKYEKQIRELQVQNDLLWKAANGRLLNTLKKVEEQHFQLKHQEVCPELKSKLTECYGQSKHMPLKCSPIVKQFVESTQQTRKALLK